MKHLPREHQRAYITFYLRVFEGNGFLGFLIDISREGMKLLSDNILETGREYLIRMKLPASLEWKGRKDEDRSIEFSAACQWSKHDYIEKEFYISGFKFSNLGDEEQAIIHEMITAYRIP
ncbi:MAG: PilZ domain-containing protein [Spirochaetes bacterium]|nr:PilZ domain-containing protein [Spirochaetota bacterium]